MKSSFTHIAIVALALLCVGGLATPEPAAADALTRALRQDIEQFVRSRVQGPVQSIEVPALRDFELRDVDPNRVRFDLSANAAGRRRDTIPVTVVMSDEERVLKRGVVTARVRSQRTILVADRPLSRGEILRESDLRTEHYEARSVPSGTTGKLASLVGMELKRSVSEGAAMRIAWVERPSLVERGDTVRVIVEKSGLRIEGVGRAVSGGSLGEQIRVVNLDSRREVAGRITSRGVVHVDF